MITGGIKGIERQEDEEKDRGIRIGTSSDRERKKIK